MKLRVGVIGLGVGESHVRSIASHPGSEIVAICDLDQNKFEPFRSIPSIRKFTVDADEVLTDPALDLVVIASYDDAHYPQILTGLSHNKHLFVEKPLCLRESEAREIKAALEKRPQLKLSSNLILRRSPRFVQLREMIFRGELGELFYLEGDYNYGRVHKITEGWRGQIPYYSPVLGGGIHVVDLMLWLSGGSVTEVQATGNNIATRGSQYRFHDLVIAILHFSNGMKAKVGVNFGCVYPHFHRLNVYGTRATFENTADAGLFFTARDSASAAPPTRLTTAYPGVEKGALLTSFLEAVKENREPEIPFSEILKGLAVSFAIEEASRGSGRAVVPKF